jgi:hypothetical protein
MLLFLNLVSAVPPVTQVQQFPSGYVIADAKQYDLKLGEDYTYHFFLYNVSNGVVITNDSVWCQFFSANHNGVIVTAGNVSFDTAGKFWYYYISPTIYNESGYYSFVINCQNTDAGGALASYFYVSPSGNTLETSISMIILFVLSILIIFMVFAIRGIFKADEGGWQIVYICLSYILLFSVFFLLWLVSKNYLYDLPILESVFWIIWLVLSILFFPFIIIISAYILKKQAEALMEKDFVQQGYTREEARDMSKKSRRR